MWQLIQSELASEEPLPQHLVESISGWVVSQEMTSLKIEYIYRVCGGLAGERSRKIQELSGAFYMFKYSQEGVETALWLFSNHDGGREIPWTKIRSMTELGNRTP